jgi:hypothetical protein
MIRFKLSSPSEPGEVQDMLGIKEEGSFIISAKVRLTCWPLAL